MARWGRGYPIKPHRAVFNVFPVIYARTETGVGRIQKTATQTITGKANTQAGVNQTITGKAQISTYQHITGKANLLNNVNRTNTGVGRITKTVAQTTTGKANIIPRSDLEQVRSGLIDDSGFDDASLWFTMGDSPFVTGSGAVISSSNTSSIFSLGRETDPNHSSNEGVYYIDLQTNFAISIDHGSSGSNNAYSAVFGAAGDTGGPNYEPSTTDGYFAQIAKTSGGTSYISKVVGGTVTQLASVTGGGTGRSKFYRIGNVYGLVTPNSAHVTYTESSPPALPGHIAIGATPSSGTSNYTYDTMDLSYSNTVEVIGLASGQYAAVLNSGGGISASAAAVAGEAQIDMSAFKFPYTGTVRVYTNSSLTTEVTYGRYPNSGLSTTIRGGDRYYMNFRQDPTTAGLSVLSLNGHSGYATTQFSSKGGGLIKDNVMFGVYMARGGYVMAYKQDLATLDVTEYNLGYTNDQHDSFDLVADSFGYLHVIYGGTYNTSDTKYRKSSSIWDISAWSSPVSVGGSVLGTLLIDQADTLYIIGSEFASSGKNPLGIHFYKKTYAGSWTGPTTLVNDADDWAIWHCDSVVGVETSGQKSLHALFYTVDMTGTTEWKHQFYIRSLDGGSTWQGIAGNTYSIPMTQNNTTGVITGMDNFQNGDSYVGHFTVKANLDVYAIVPYGASGTIGGGGGNPGAGGQRTWNFYKGTSGSGWSASLHYFDLSFTAGPVGLVANESNIVVIMPTFRDSSFSLPADMVQYNSADGGTTWTSRVIYSGDITDGQMYWPRLTPVVAGAGYGYKLVWHNRFSNYAINSARFNSGTSTVFAADVTLGAARNITGKGSIAIQTNRTETGVARLAKTASGTETGVGRVQKQVNATITGTGGIANLASQTNTGKARLEKSVNQTNTGVGRIQKSVNQTTTGTSRIEKAVQANETGVGRLEKATLATITGKADIAKDTAATTTGVARLQKTVTGTITGVGRVAKTVTQDNTGVARIAKNVNQTETGTARLQKTVAQTETGVGTITNATTRTVTGVADIAKNTLQTITGVGRIQKQVNTTITGLGRIAVTATATVTGVARLQKTVAQTESGVAKITNAAQVPITGVGRITNTGSQTNTGKARIQKAVNQNETGVSRISKQVNTTVTGTARLTNTGSGTVTGKGRIQKAANQTNTGKAKIDNQATQTVTGRARLGANGTATITGVGRLQKAVQASISGKGSIGGGAAQTITGKGRVGYQTTKTIVGRTAVLNATNRSITGKSTIAVNPATRITAPTAKGITLEPFTGDIILESTSHNLGLETTTGNITLEE